MKTIITLLALAALTACSPNQPLPAPDANARQFQIETKVNVNPTSTPTNAAQR